MRPRDGPRHPPLPSSRSLPAISLEQLDVVEGTVGNLVGNGLSGFRHTWYATSSQASYSRVFPQPPPACATPSSDDWLARGGLARLDECSWREGCRAPR